MDVREKLEVIAHLGDHITYKEDIGICYDSTLAKVIEDAYMELKSGVTVQEWISVKDMLPEEHDCFFTSYYGTNKWQDGMFRQISDTVLAVVEYEDGKIRVKATVTKDGKWDFSKFYRASKVTHWMPLPQPPKGE